MKSISITIALGLCLTNVLAEKKTTPSNAGNYGVATPLGIIKNKELIELSGVVCGGVNNDLLWVHNDRHNLPRLYALNRKAETVGTYNLNIFDEAGMMLGDWEDLARMPGGEKGNFDLCIGDIGNNAMEEKVYGILVVPEPVVDQKRSSEVIDIEFKTILFTFPKGYACNNEALLVHPVSQDIYIVSKRVKKGDDFLKNSHVWVIPATRDYETVHAARLIMGSIPAIEEDEGKVTGGEISSDGKSLVLTTNKAIGYLWELDGTTPLKTTLSESPHRIALAKERGNEAICFSRDQSELFSVYDGKKEDRPLNVYIKN